MKNLTFLPEKLLAWYPTHRRALPWREDPVPYRVWISEIMLQQTRIEAVIPYFERFMAELPDVFALAACDDDRLMKLWQGLGYYSRARSLKRAAEVIVRDHGGELPRDLDALLALPGIGDYTAGAIASIAMGQPQPAVDGNVLRVVTRVTACPDDITKAPTKRAVTGALREIYPSGAAAGMLTEALMALGQQVCIPNGEPRCEVCPLAGECEAHRQNRTGEFPVKPAKAARKIERRTVLILRRGGEYAVRKRPERGLLAGLWELPSLPGEADADALAAFLAGEGLAHTGEPHDLGEAVHIFTHLEWHMRGLMLDVVGEPRSLTFAPPEALRGEYAIPSAFRAYMKQILP